MWTKNIMILKCVSVFWYRISGKIDLKAIMQHFCSPMEKLYPAHIRISESEAKVQSCAEHCRNTAEYASASLESVRLSTCGRLIGLIHDSGKNTSAFADYLDRASRGLPVRRGSVNHSSAGLRYLLEQYHNGQDAAEFLSAELLAYAVGAHHGLFDCQDGQQLSAFDRRAEQAEEYPAVMQRFFLGYSSEPEMDALFHAAVEELTPALLTLYNLPAPSLPNEDADNEILFSYGLLERLLLSALIDADRRDTAEFMLDMCYPSWPKDRRPIWQDCLTHMEQALDRMPSDTEIQKARHKISDQCVQAAEGPCGVYQLNIPTGGGKTLSGLRYALAHAAKYNKRHLIFTSPLLSILEQNAAVIREAVGNNSLILEHHSNVVRPSESTDELNTMELLTETWEAPIILTTLVQFLDTAFSGKSTCIRRFHALADSVIVIDEVQTVPPNLLTLFNLLIRFLTEVCRSTVVLCSATQPELAQTDHPLQKVPPELIPRQPELWEVFHRTDLRIAKSRRLDEIPALVLDVLSNADSVLVVCNKKAEAETLYRTLFGGDCLCFHLSAAMCVQHRRDTLDALKAALAQQDTLRKKVICISTQVIEAGVDISFEQVIRFCAGMDSIVQAAGRCNRNGESALPAPVWIVDCVDENLSHLEEIRRGKEASIRLFTDFRKSPEHYDGDLASDAAIRQYYRYYYGSMDTHAQDAPKHGMTLFDLLGRNEKFDSGDSTNSFILRQAFKTAGSLFTVFDDDTASVIVPYGAGRTTVERLIAENRKAPRNYVVLRELTQNAKPYTVSLRHYEIEILKKKGALIELFEGSVLVLSDGFYEEATGFSMKNDESTLMI